MAGIIIPDFTYEDFVDGTAPYEFVQSIDNNFQRKRVLEKVSKKAVQAGVKGFVSMFKLYVQEVQETIDCSQNFTEFSGQEMQLQSGAWECDDFGIRSYDRIGLPITACSHPIMPIRRLINIDTQCEMLELAYYKGKRWRKLIVDKKTLASNNAIIALAEKGIAVNSENARYLVKYLGDIESLNYDAIPEVNSVGRLGWIDGYGFSPYVDNLIFDGAVQFEHFFNAVSEKGDFEVWKSIASEIRKSNSVQGKIALAASFSSALVYLLGALPFFVHFWGTTEAGKTVALMVSASVWANPKVGEYIHTFNSTTVSQELSAAFVNSLPLIYDELQIIKDRKEFDSMIYMLTEGVGKGRGAKAGGLQKTGTWANCIITSGEQPIATSSSGGGAVNRVIEIECNSGSIFDNCRNVAETLKKNYGIAGKMFAEKLADDDNVTYAKKIYDDFITELSKSEATEKQSISASIVLTAEKLISEWIFKDSVSFTTNDLKPFLSTKTQVSAELRAYSYLKDRLVMADANFVSDRTMDNIIKDLWGIDDDEYTYIIGSKYEDILREGGFNPTALLRWLGRKKLIERDEKDNKDKRNKKINGKTVRCVWLKKREFEETDFLELSDVTQPPF